MGRGIGQMQVPGPIHQPRGGEDALVHRHQIQEAAVFRDKAAGGCGAVPGIAGELVGQAAAANG